MSISPSSNVRFRQDVPAHIIQERASAAKELLFRKQIRSSLAAYARMQGFEPAAHHLMIIDRLEKITRDELDLLLVFAPPGSAKSSFISVLFPAWHLANNPNHNYLAATHSAEFASRWGRKVRNDISDPQTSVRLGISVSADNAAAEQWSLTSGGQYYGVGAGASISGIRADIAAIDDPFGSREDAFSPSIREKRWNWYLDDFSARMKPKAKRIIVATRWHEDDISGRVLRQIEELRKNPDENSYELRADVLSFPAIAEENDILGRAPGTFLWDDPTGYNYAKYLRARKKESSPMMWSALFQQRPAPETGDFFQEQWLKPFKGTIFTKEGVALDEQSPPLRIYGASDYAVTKDDGDYTVHVVIGLDHNGNMYLIDLWRAQTSPDQWIDQFCKLVKQYKPLEWGEEGGQIKASVGPFISKRQVETEAYVFRRQFPTRADKAIRAQSIRSRMATQGLYVNPSAHYYTDFRNELLSFPAGKYDDQVDALSLIGQMIDHIIPGEAPPPPPIKPRFLQDITLDELWEKQPHSSRTGQRI